MTPQESAVLAYYERENRGVIEKEVLGGLRLSAFRGARTSLVNKGMLVVSRRGRYVPVAALDDRSGLHGCDSCGAEHSMRWKQGTTLLACDSCGAEVEAATPLSEAA